MFSLRVLVSYYRLSTSNTSSPLATYLQYDIVKRVERMGKSVGMLTGQAEPTIIQPSMYRKRFNAAMERYFMTIPVSG